MKSLVLYSLFLFSTLFFSFLGKPVYSQSTDTSNTQINWQIQDSLVQFQSQLRPLRQIAGAPEAFYTYFWEFGDGAFSFDKKPEHVFSDSGKYTIRLYATNNYDDGKAPPTRPRKIKINSGSALAANKNHSGFFNEDHHLQLKVNRMPKPNEDMVCIIGYKNPKSSESTLKGSLVLFYNDKKFKNNNFGLTDLRKYHEETPANLTNLLANVRNRNRVPVYAFNEVAVHGPRIIRSVKEVGANTAANLLMQKQEIFETENTLHFDALKPGEDRYVFAVLHTTPKMIKDTNATVTLSAMMIPDDPTKPILETNLELQIVASHDPNRLMLSNRYLNYRFLGKHKQLKYEVRFQNTGKGPASTVDVGVSIPPTLNPTSIEIKDMYPKCVPCATAYTGQSCLDTLISKDSIHFIFKNVHLPGIQQEGVEDKDSTKGFVEYRLRFKEKPPKRPFYSQAGIVFDTNDPVYTNKMHTRFFPGISPAIIAGYQMGFNDKFNINSPLVIGAALSPYSPYRTYFQVEAYLEFYGEDTYSQLTELEKPRDTFLVADDPQTGGQREQKYRFTKKGFQTTRKLVSLDIVPLEVRNNLTDWLSIGGGIWLKGNLYEKATKTPEKFLKSLAQGDRSYPDSTLLLKKMQTTATEHFSQINFGGFIDINIGKVRVGPALGARLFHFFNPNKTGLMLYAIWRL